MPPPELLLPPHLTHPLPARIRTKHIHPIPLPNRPHTINLPLQIRFQLPQRIKRPTTIAATVAEESREVVHNLPEDFPVALEARLAEVEHADGGADGAEIFG